MGKIMEIENNMTWQMFFEKYEPCEDFVIDGDNDAPQTRDLF